MHLTQVVFSVVCFPERLLRVGITHICMLCMASCAIVRAKRVVTKGSLEFCHLQAGKECYLQASVESSIKN